MLNSLLTHNFTLSHIPLNWGDEYGGVIPLVIFPITKNFKNIFELLKMSLSQWGWSPRKFKDNCWVFLSCKGRESLFSDMLEVRNNFSKIEWKKDHFFSKFYVQNRQFQGIKKLGDLATPQGFWKHLGVVKTQTKNCAKSVYCTTLHKAVTDP